MAVSFGARAGSDEHLGSDRQVADPRSLTARCTARAIPVSWRPAMPMPSTIALNWMIEHHIIYTISGHDHRPARPAPLRRHREDDVSPEQKGSFFAARRRAMI